MNRRIQSILIRPEVSIKEAMRVINESVHQDPPAPGGIALVVSEKGTLAGVLTDGDIRRALLSGRDLDEPVSGIMNHAPVTVSSGLGADQMLAFLLSETKRRGLRSTAFDKLIVVDEGARPHDVITFFELWRRTDVKTRTVAIVGLGYVGLTLALTLADMDVDVIGTDVDHDVLGQIRSGETHFHERGLREMLLKNLGTRFRVADGFPADASDVYVIAVGTPVGEDKEPQLEALKASVGSVARVLKRFDLVVLRSTVPVGTTRGVVLPMLERESGLRAGEDFFLAFAPERTVEGNALEELRSLPQVVGGIDPTSTELAGKLFHLITPNIVPVSSLEEAELVKLLNNSYRDLTFAFANEIAGYCHAIGLEANRVIRAANEGYVRGAIPLPSPGVGGPCLTKDPYILASSARSAGVGLELPLLSRRVNEQTITEIRRRVDRFFENAGKQPERGNVFIAGMAFKGEPETGDIRNSTSLLVAEALRAQNFTVTVHDPVFAEQGAVDIAGFPAVSIVEGFSSADAVLVLNNHRFYRGQDIVRLANTMARPGLLFDAWHIFANAKPSLPDGVHYQTL